MAGAAVLGRLNDRCARPAWQTATVGSVDRRDGARADASSLDVPDWAGPPRRPAPGRPAHRRGRLPGRALLLDRLGAGRAGRDHGGAARRRRGLPLPDRGAARRATSSSCAARSAATSSGSAGRTAARCCWSPAARASCRCGRCCGTGPGRASDGPGPAAVLRRGAGRGHLPGRARPYRGRRDGELHADQAAAAGLDRLRAAGRTQQMLAEVAWPAAQAPLAYVCGPTSFVEAVAGRRWSRSATRRGGSRPSGSARRAAGEAGMERWKRLLDGNAIGGLLIELFGTEMTTAIGTCGSCGDGQPGGRAGGVPARAGHRGPLPRRATACSWCSSRSAASPASTCRAWPA